MPAKNSRGKKRRTHFRKSWLILKDPLSKLWIRYTRTAQQNTHKNRQIQDETKQHIRECVAVQIQLKKNMQKHRHDILFRDREATMEWDALEQYDEITTQWLC